MAQFATALPAIRSTTLWARGGRTVRSPVAGEEIGSGGREIQVSTMSGSRSR